MKNTCNLCGTQIGRWSTFQVNLESGTQLLCGECWNDSHNNNHVKTESSPATRAPESSAKKTKPQPAFDSQQLILSELVAAQNRTTHAVRSLAITFVAAPIISLLVIVCVFIALQSENTALIVIAGVGGVVITLGTFIIALEELSESKVSS